MSHDESFLSHLFTSRLEYRFCNLRGNENYAANISVGLVRGVQNCELLDWRFNVLLPNLFYVGRKRSPNQQQEMYHRIVTESLNHLTDLLIASYMILLLTAGNLAPDCM